MDRRSSYIIYFRLVVKNDFEEVKTPDISYLRTGPHFRMREDFTLAGIMIILVTFYKLVKCWTSDHFSHVP